MSSKGQIQDNPMESHNKVGSGGGGGGGGGGGMYQLSHNKVFQLSHNKV